MIQGVTYVFSFDARSDSNRTIIADVAKGYSPWSSYTGSMNKIIAITKEMQTFNFKFTMDSLSDKKARITFNCGSSILPVYIDNISLHDENYIPAPVMRHSDRRSGDNRFLNIGRKSSITAISFSGGTAACPDEDFRSERVYWIFQNLSVRYHPV